MMFESGDMQPAPGRLDHHLASIQLSVDLATDCAGNLIRAAVRLRPPMLVYSRYPAGFSALDHCRRLRSERTRNARGRATVLQSRPHFAIHYSLVFLGGASSSG